jgi:hypothetical protein
MTRFWKQAGGKMILKDKRQEEKQIEWKSCVVDLKKNRKTVLRRRLKVFSFFSPDPIAI